MPFPPVEASGNVRASACPFPLRDVRAARRLPHPAARDRRDPGRRGRHAVIAGRIGTRHQRLDPEHSVPLAPGSGGGADHPQQHCDVDHDGGLDRVRDPPDDADAGIDAILAAHSDQLCQGPHHAMDAWASSSELSPTAWRHCQPPDHCRIRSCRSQR